MYVHDCLSNKIEIITPTPTHTHTPTPTHTPTHTHTYTHPHVHTPVSDVGAIVDHVHLDGMMHHVV